MWRKASRISGVIVSPFFALVSFFNSALSRFPGLDVEADDEWPEVPLFDACTVADDSAADAATAAASLPTSRD